MSFMLLFGSVSYANGLAKQDVELLFGTQKIAKVQAVTLDKNEMAKTEGEFWHIIFYVTLYTMAYLNAPRYGGKVYHGYPWSFGRPGKGGKGWGF